MKQFGADINKLVVSLLFIETYRKLTLEMSQTAFSSSAPHLRMILPKPTCTTSSTQPIQSKADAWICQNCSRSFKTDRGCKQHQKKCTSVIVDSSVIVRNGTIGWVTVDDLPDITFVEDSLPMAISHVAIPISIPLAGDAGSAGRQQTELEEVSATEGEGSAAQGEGSVTEGEGRAAHGEVSATEGEGRAAQGKVRAIEGEGKAAQGDMSATEGEGRAAQGEVNATEGEVIATEGDVSATEGRATEGGGRAAQSEVNAARGEVSAAQVEGRTVQVE